MSLALPEYFAVTSLAIFSLADLRYRLAPGIEAFFLASILISVPTNPLGTAMVVMAFAWGWMGALPGWLVLPLLFLPSNWPLLLTGFGVRHGLVGRGDLLAITGLACLFPWPALVLALLGLEVWRKIWRKRQGGPVPALPGLLLGILVYLLIRIVFLPV